MKRLFFISALFILNSSFFALNLNAQRQVEYLDRGLFAQRCEDGIFLSWRLRSNEKDAQFVVYKNGKKWKTMSAKDATNLIDTSGKFNDVYQVSKVSADGTETDKSAEVKPLFQDYMELSLQRPEPGKTDIAACDFSKDKHGIDMPDGMPYKYAICEGSCGDLDGDGQYELVLKWEPRPANYDNGQKGVSGPCIIDAYKISGGPFVNANTQSLPLGGDGGGAQLLWRINLGRNIRSGSHYTQFLIYDFDGDGKAEVVMRTAPGSKDGTGKDIIMSGDDPNADYRVTMQENRNRVGFMKTGPEYLTVFRGIDGAEICSVPFHPERGDIKTWGDDYGNRADRFLAAAAYLDGVHPSIIMARGYYMKSAVAAFSFDGKSLKEQWEVVSPTPNSYFDINGAEHTGKSIYAAGNHNLTIADVDGDGKDEVVHANCVIDNDGTVLYNTNLKHGDAMHVGILDPSRKGLQTFTVHEEKETFPTAGMEMHDALTGEVLWKVGCNEDNGKGIAADIDPTSKGSECWSYCIDGTYSAKGKKLYDAKPKAMSFRVYWDDDLLDELYWAHVYKWDYEKQELKYSKEMSGSEQANGTKMTPVLQADLFGDWREEIITCVKGDGAKIRIYSTDYLTDYRLYTLMDDPQYRMSIVWQNCAYNQPPHLSFWLGAGPKTWPWPQNVILKK